MINIFNYDIPIEVLWFPILLVILIIAFHALLKQIRFHCYQFVITTSLRYHELLLINERYQFNDLDINSYFYFDASSKQQYDNCNFDAILNMKIQHDQVFFQQIISMLDQNRRLAPEYQREINNLPKLKTKKDIQGSIIPFFIYNRIEMKLIFVTIMKPIIEPTYTYRVKYSSPKGKNHYQKGMIYSFDELKEHYKSVQEAIEFRESKAYQRSLMTKKLRYQVLRRDNYRCVLCGATVDDLVKLHVDHIRPIAKGGKTEEQNLRTLCFNCNMGKSDMYDEFGVN